MAKGKGLGGRRRAGIDGDADYFIESDIIS